MAAVSRMRRSAWDSEVCETGDANTWRDIFWKNLDDYCDSTTMHGYRYLTEPGRHWIERLIWTVVHVLVVWGAAYIILGVWNEYLNTPTVTTVNTTAFPISNIPFPAVALCNINKISFSKARWVAQELAPGRNVSVDALFKSLWNLGRLYDFDNSGCYEVTNLHSLLTAGNHTYNVSQIMDQGYLQVLVYNPRDFPDTPSGGLIEKLVPPDMEVFFRLEATSVYSVPAVKGFHLSQRGCLFRSELPQLFMGSYSYSDCLMTCRVRSIQTLCGCVPFYLPSNGSSRSCGMLDIECLARYKGKWATLRPTEKFPGLEKEMEVSTSCVECYPACSDTTYHVQASSSSLADHLYDTSLFLEGVNNLSGHSIFHIFFGKFTSTLLKQDVLYYWYDLMSNFGGICGLFVGFSLISVVEFIYFFTFRLFFLLKDSSYRDSKDKELEGHENSDVYWKEIVPTRYNHRY